MCGIDVEKEGLFSGSCGRQIAGRFASIATHPFAYGTRQQRDEWAALVATLEQVLRLHHYEPGTLMRHAEYLYQRTGGMIGSLSHLVREAAIVAILDGTERVTREILDGISSYVRRLAEANGLDPRVLVRHLGRGGAIPTRQSESELRRTVRKARADNASILRVLAKAKDRSPTHREIHEKALRERQDIRRRAQRSATFDAAFEEQDLILNDRALARLAVVSGYPPDILRRTFGCRHVWHESSPNDTLVSIAPRCWTVRNTSSSDGVHKFVLYTFVASPVMTSRYPRST